VRYLIRELGGRDITVRGDAAVVELPDGSLLDLAARSFERPLAAGGVITVDDAVLLPEAYYDAVRGIEPGAGLESIFQRSFVGFAGSDQEVEQANVVLIPTGTLGADFAVTRIALVFPTNGTTTPVGGRMRARALVFGTGSGSAIGNWSVDGIPFDIFSIELTGGRSTEIETLIPIPSDVVGSRRLTVEIVDPSPLSSRAIHYLVTPRNIEPMRWLHPPGFRHYLRSGALPEWSWTARAAVAGYQIRIDRRTAMRVASARFELPAAVRDRLATGGHAIEVRPIYPGQDPDLPLVEDLLEGTFHLIDAPLTIATSGSTDPCCSWSGPPGDGLFAIVVLDGRATAVVQRKLTRLRHWSPASTWHLLDARERHYWRVEALNDLAETIGRSEPQELTGVPAR